MQMKVLWMRLVVVMLLAVSGCDGKKSSGGGKQACTSSLQCGEGEQCVEGICEASEGEQDCSDGLDNDEDELVDCADTDCFEDGACKELVCDDGEDNDEDGQTDCADTDCNRDVACFESNCGDGEDNDGDGQIDCSDSDCSESASCVERNCSNGRDDDGDGRVDCSDTDCSDSASCIEQDCSDGVDDDGDGQVDCLDADCRGEEICTESVCDDGIDDDGDGFFDCDDTDCSRDAACVEGDCDNLLDDDGDGLVDCMDGDCSEDGACKELVCDDMEAVGGAGGEEGFVPVDNDGDGYANCADEDCREDRTCMEVSCSDYEEVVVEAAGGAGGGEGGAQVELVPVDNDGDGYANCEDSECFNHIDCLGEDGSVSIAAPGGRVVLSGSLDESDAAWTRPMELCGEGENSGQYVEGIRIVNETGREQKLDLRAAWGGGDGYLFVYLDPFVAETPQRGCIKGNDDFASDARQSGLSDVVIGVDEVLVVVASSYGAEQEIGSYRIEVLTQALVEECGDGLDNDEDGEVDCRDTECTYSLSCIEVCDDGKDNDRDGDMDCMDAACERHVSCIDGDASIPIAARGQGIVLRGSLTEASLEWSRWDASCRERAGAEPSHVQSFTVVNETGRRQWITVNATWQGDGYLHVFEPPFSVEAGAELGCVEGNDDAYGINAFESLIERVEMQPGEELVVVASSYAARDAIGRFSIEVFTEGPEEQCGDGIDNDVDGRIDCEDMSCRAEEACIPRENKCEDGLDNDGDRLSDCDDDDCRFEAACVAREIEAQEVIEIGAPGEIVEEYGELVAEESPKWRRPEEGYCDVEEPVAGELGVGGAGGIGEAGLGGAGGLMEAGGVAVGGGSGGQPMAMAGQEGLGGAGGEVAPEPVEPVEPEVVEPKLPRNHGYKLYRFVNHTGFRQGIEIRAEWPEGAEGRVYVLRAPFAEPYDVTEALEGGCTEGVSLAEGSQGLIESLEIADNEEIRVIITTQEENADLSEYTISVRTRSREICFGDVDDDENGDVDCEDAACANHAFCQNNDIGTRYQIAEPGGAILLEGEVDGQNDSETWNLGTEDCEAPEELPRHFQVFSVVNQTGRNQVIDIEAIWGSGDGFLHVFDEGSAPFRLSEVEVNEDNGRYIGCVRGNDDGRNNATSHLLNIEILPEQELHITVSNELADENLGPYQLIVRTQAAEMCQGGEDEDRDGLTDCDDPDCAREQACALAVGDGVVEIAPRGEEIALQGGMNSDSPLWQRATFDCEEQEERYFHYNTVRIVNRTGEAQEISLRADWGIQNGFIFLYRSGERLERDDHLDECLLGNDNGRDVGESNIERYTIENNQELTVVLSGQFARLPIDRYGLTIRTEAPLESERGYCEDGRDNDSDMLTDCEDPDCGASNACVEVCDDLQDNDADGLIDCADSDCDTNAVCQEVCDDGLDNDLDGFIDCQDTSCEGNEACIEGCDDGIDNDADGVVDCRDFDCRNNAACDEVCNDGLDNDLDGAIDCDDTDCIYSPSCFEANCRPVPEQGAGGAGGIEAELIGGEEAWDSDNDEAFGCNDDDCANHQNCLTQDEDAQQRALEIAEPGGVITVRGSLNDEDSLWIRPDGNCTVPEDRGANTYFESFKIVNSSDIAQRIDIMVNWERSFNGSLFIFSDAFDVAESQNAEHLRNTCIDGIVELFSYTIRRFSNVEIASNQELVIVATTFGARAEVESYHIDVSTRPIDGANPAEICNDDIDNDRDGPTDCLDRDCDENPACVEAVCDDGEDNDLDGQVDCEDEDCRFLPICEPLPSGEQDCENGMDDDGDGAVDCRDRDCEGEPACEEDCDNGEDDNGDGQVDCRDVQCIDAPECPEDCTDELDNDGDGAVDCRDLGCRNDFSCMELCADGIDNDGNGAVDCEDERCSNYPGCDETLRSFAYINWPEDLEGSIIKESAVWTRPSEVCEAGEGLYFVYAVKMWNAPPRGARQFRIEVEWPEGSNGFVHALRFPFDPEILEGCIRGNDDAPAVGGGAVTSRSLLTNIRVDADERIIFAFSTANPMEELGDFTYTITAEASIEECNNEADDDGDGLVDCDDPYCDDAANCFESDCGDGDDEDGDGDVDCADLDCDGDAACMESNCDDGIDDEGDGAIDCQDIDCDGDVACTEICTDGVGNDSDDFIDCTDRDCDDWSDCLAGERIAIPAPGETKTLRGSIDAGDRQWDRLSQRCLGGGAANHYYESFRVFNPSNEAQLFNINAVWSLNGYLHVFETPFDLVSGQGCLDGNDNYGNEWMSFLEYIQIEPGQELVIVASTWEEEVEIDWYQISLTTISPEICGDGIDNDLDGDTDCADSDCYADPLCQEICDNGRDDDLDGRRDCIDSDCEGHPTCIESICDDDADNDLDEGTDCEDSDCAFDAACFEFDCADGRSNDDDALVDCDDPDCANFGACAAAAVDPISVPAEGDEALVIQGMSEARGQVWTRTDEACMLPEMVPDAPQHNYEVFRFVGGEEPSQVIISAQWDDGVDGYLHVYRGVFDSADQETNCAQGNDDWNADITQSRILNMDVDANGEIIVVLSTANPNVEIGNYQLEIQTYVPEVCDDGVDDDLDGQIDCRDSDCMYFIDCIEEGAGITIAEPGDSITLRGSIDGNEPQWDRLLGDCSLGDGPENHFYETFEITNTGAVPQTIDLTAHWRVNEFKGGPRESDYIHTFRHRFDPRSNENCMTGDSELGGLRSRIEGQVIEAGETLVIVASTNIRDDVIGAYDIEVSTRPAEICNDVGEGEVPIDNDGDGDANCEDSDCSDYIDCLDPPNVIVPTIGEQVEIRGEIQMGDFSSNARGNENCELIEAPGGGSYLYDRFILVNDADADQQVIIDAFWSGNGELLAYSIDTIGGPEDVANCIAGNNDFGSRGQSRLENLLVPAQSRVVIVMITEEPNTEIGEYRVRIANALEAGGL